MPKGDTVELRIYCICGQKMKVSASMLGRPGKCIACRQKIRIPRIDEIPEDTSELFLKDHPELLRKPAKRPSAKPADATFPAEGEEAPGEDDAFAHGPPALDILEPLRNLCSLEHSIARKLATLREYDDAHGRSRVRDELLAYQQSVEEARMDFDEQLRQRLMEVAIELANTHEKIAATGLSVRVGEIDFRSFREKVDKLRRRREALERLQHNLRGWLSCHDPHTAGGYVELTYDQIPRDGIRLNVSADSESGPPLVDGHLENMREALFERERVERKLREAERLRQSGVAAGAGMAEIRADGRAEKRRAETAVRFYRSRLEQLKNDYDSDLLAVASQMDLARGRLQVSELTRSEFEQIETELIRVKIDMTKAVDLLGRAVNANTVRDLPHARGTFLGRLARPVGQQSIEADSWIVWGAALAAILSAFLPAVGAYSGLGVFRHWTASYPLAHWFLSAPILCAGLLALAGLIPRRGMRGTVVLTLGVAMCVGAAAGLHEAGYSATDVGKALRESGLARPGIALFYLAAAIAFLSAGVALIKVPKGWVALPVAALGTGAALVGVHFDWGYFTPAPQISVSTRETTGSAAWNTQVTLANAGHRKLVVLTEDSASTGATRAVEGPNTYYFTVEQRIGQESWQPQHLDELQGPSTARQILAPGQSTTRAYRLAPGTYRAELTAENHEASVVPAVFTIEGPPPTTKIAKPTAPTTAPQSSPTEPTSASRVAAATARLASGLSMELTGILTSEGHEPQFTIMVYRPDGSTRERRLTTGDMVYDKWLLREFNRQQDTVTITNGVRVYVLRHGERVDIASNQ